MTPERDWPGLTDEEFRERVLSRVLDEARRRRFTIQIDPFNLLSRDERESGARRWLPHEIAGDGRA